MQLKKWVSVVSGQDRGTLKNAWHKTKKTPSRFYRRNWVKLDIFLWYPQNKKVKQSDIFSYHFYNKPDIKSS